MLLEKRLSTSLVTRPRMRTGGNLKVRKQMRNVIIVGIAVVASVNLISLAQQSPQDQCPDLVIGGLIALQPTDGISAVPSATVYNISQAEVPSPFWVSLVDISCCQWEVEDQHVFLSESQLHELNETGSINILFPEIAFPNDITPCFLCRGTFVVDSQHDVDESCHPTPMGEFNNSGSPDLEIEVTNTSCECTGCEPLPQAECFRWGMRFRTTPLGPWGPLEPCCLQWGTVMAAPQPTCEAQIEYIIRNIGTQPTGPFMSLAQSEDGYSQEVPVMTGLIEGAELVQASSYTFHPDWLPLLSTTLTILADSENEIVNDPRKENNTVNVQVNCNCSNQEYYCLDEPLSAICNQIPPEDHVDLSIHSSPSCLCKSGLYSLPKDNEYGCQIAVDATVIATGPGEVSPISIKISDVTCGKPIDIVGKYRLTSSQLSELNKNGSVLLEDVFTWTVPHNQDEKLCFSYALTVDSENAVLECPEGGEENNTRIEEFCCCPDLAIELSRERCRCETRPIYKRQCIKHGNPPATPPCLEWSNVLIGYETECTARIYYTIENVGTQDAQSFYVELGSSTGYTDSTYIASLPAGETRTRWFDFAVDTGGTISILLTADAKDDVAECNEDNNTADSTIKCR